MPSLAEFQSRFCNALLHPDSPFGNQFGTGMQVYRNTIVNGLIEVLRANYPTVETLVGQEWFHDAAREFVLSNLPNEPALAMYGDGFAEFLTDIPSLAAFPYVSHVATLDRLWTETHFSEDSEHVRAAELMTMPQESLLLLSWILNPTVRIAWLPHSAVSIWRASRFPQDHAGELQVDGSEEGALLIRTQGAVQVLPLERDAVTLLKGVKRGLLMRDALAESLAAHPAMSANQILAKLIDIGAFARVE